MGMGMGKGMGKGMGMGKAMGKGKGTEFFFQVGCCVLDLVVVL